MLKDAEAFKAEIRELIKNMTEEKKVILWNTYIYKKDIYESEINQMSSFDEVFYGVSLLRVIDALAEDFNTYDDYFWTDDCGVIQSNDYPTECGIVDMQDIVDYIAEYEDPLEDKDVKILIKKYQEGEKNE